MILTPGNYFSKEANYAYLSTSQYKDFVGTLGRPGCEARAMAKLRGEWQQEMTTPLLVGSYVDAHFEGTLGNFRANNPEIFKASRKESNRKYKLKVKERKNERNKILCDM